MPTSVFSIVREYNLIYGTCMFNTERFFIPVLL